jgi:hypothetical protein
MSSLLYIDIYRFITLLDSHVKMNFPSKNGPMKFADIGGQSMPVTKIMDVKINYEDEGEGYPILFK